MTIYDKTYNWAYGPTYRKRTDRIVIHHAAAASATPEDIHRWHLGNGWRGIAYHFYVRKDGSVIRGREENAAGGHTTNYNSTSIGICFEGNFDTEKMASVQVRAGQELLAYLRGKWGDLPVNKHSELNSTACPGKNFPWDMMLYPPTDEPTDTDAEKSGDPSPWAKDACDWAVKAGLFLGDGNENYDWQGVITREALAVILQRGINRGE